jgi:hypothetical protein
VASFLFSHVTDEYGLKNLFVHSTKFFAGEASAAETIDCFPDKVVRGLAQAMAEVATTRRTLLLALAAQYS